MDIIAACLAKAKIDRFLYINDLFVEEDVMLRFNLMSVSQI